jgi:hypothetical protein
MRCVVADVSIMMMRFVLPSKHCAMPCHSVPRTAVRTSFLSSLSHFCFQFFHLWPTNTLQQVIAAVLRCILRDRMFSLAFDQTGHFFQVHRASPSPGNANLGGQMSNGRMGVPSANMHASHMQDPRYAKRKRFTTCTLHAHACPLPFLLGSLSSPLFPSTCPPSFYFFLVCSLSHTLTFSFFSLSHLPSLSLYIFLSSLQ